jgi:hypothetical protein
MFPSPLLETPTLDAYQFSYDGLTFGGFGEEDPYHLLLCEGLYDEATIVTGDAKRPLDQGEFAGIDSAGGKDMILQFAVRTDGTSFDHARQALSGAMRVRGSTEKPLWFQLPSGLYAVMARPRGFVCPLDANAVQLQAAIATMRLHTTDPRVYLAPSLQASVGIPGPGEFGEITVTNEGNEGCRGVYVIEGPCLDPKILANSIPGKPFLEYDLTMVAGDVLEIDSDWETATLTHAGVTKSANKYLAEGSHWFELEPGEAVHLRFSSADVAKVAAQLHARYAHALVGA